MDLAIFAGLLIGCLIVIISLVLDKVQYNNNKSASKLDKNLYRTPESFEKKFKTKRDQRVKTWIEYLISGMDTFYESNDPLKVPYELEPKAQYKLPWDEINEIKKHFENIGWIVRVEEVEKPKSQDEPLERFAYHGLDGINFRIILRSYPEEVMCNDYNPLDLH